MKWRSRRQYRRRKIRKTKRMILRKICKRKFALARRQREGESVARLGL